MTKNLCPVVFDAKPKRQKGPAAAAGKILIALFPPKADAAGDSVQEVECLSTQKCPYLSSGRKRHLIGLQLFPAFTTVLVLRMAHRKGIETEQEPGTAEPGNMLGCCLNYFHFL